MIAWARRFSRPPLGYDKGAPSSLGFQARMTFLALTPPALGYPCCFSLNQCPLHIYSGFACFFKRGVRVGSLHCTCFPCLLIIKYQILVYKRNVLFDVAFDHFLLECFKLRTIMWPKICRLHRVHSGAERPSGRGKLYEGGTPLSMAPLRLPVHCIGRTYLLVLSVL